MVLTIGPAVRRADQRRFLAIHSLGLLLGATVMAMFLTLIGPAVESAIAATTPVPQLVAALVLALWVSRIVFGVGLPYLSSPWQVPVYWRETLPPVVTVGVFGFLLGLGLLTSVVLPIFWVFVGGTLLSGSVLVSLGAWWLYASIRAGTTIWATERRFDQSADLSRIGEVAPSHWRLVRSMSALVLTATAIWLVSAI
jgi:hypothetical protein